MEPSKNQKAKALYDKLREEEKIGLIFSGLYEDIWVAGKRKAYYITELSTNHLDNIINYYKAKEEEVPPIIKVAYELKKRMYKSKSDMIAKAGLSTQVDSDGNIILEPEYIKVQTIKVKIIKRGMYIKDPNLVPHEFKEDNILWVNQPTQVTAITESGKEIPIHLTNLDQQLIIDYETIHPDDES